jgi:hypothetical protein
LETAVIKGRRVILIRLRRSLRWRQKSSDNIPHLDVLMSEHDRTPSVGLES